MLKSMTGYGRTEQTVRDKTFLVEIKSLNGKQFELTLKIPSLLKPYEFDIRNLLSETLLRGSIDCTVTLKQNGAARPVTINTELAKSYYQPIADMAKSLNLDMSHAISALLKLPEVVSPTTDILDKNDWVEFEKVLRKAIDDINAHRL